MLSNAYGGLLDFDFTNFGGYMCKSSEGSPEICGISEDSESTSGRG